MLDGDAGGTCDGTGKITRLVGTHLILLLADKRKKMHARLHFTILHRFAESGPRFTSWQRKYWPVCCVAREMAAIFFIDLDHFKPINDLYGHRVGDEVLKQVAQRIVRCLRHEDVTGRGGDEFVVVLSFLASPDDAAHVAANIVANLECAFHVGGREIQLSGSLGISLSRWTALTLIPSSAMQISPCITPRILVGTISVFL